MSGDRLSSASTIDGILWSAAEECPRNVALTTGLESVSFEVLRSKVESFAHYLETRGVLVGQTVALLMENSLEFVIAHYAVCAIGGVVAPIVAELRGATLEQALGCCEAGHLVASREQFEAALAAGRAAEGTVIVHLLEASWDNRGTIRAGVSPESLEQVTGSVLDRAGKSDELAILFMTSGTTGTPKGIQLTHRQAMVGLEAWNRRWNYDADTVSLMVAPFSHVVYNPLVLAAHLSCGTAVVLWPPQLRSATRCIEACSVTAVMGTPSFFIQLLRGISRYRERLESLDTLIYGAAPTPVSIVRALAEEFPEASLYNCYGLTETASAVSCLGPELLAGNENSVGMAHPGVEVSIRDVEHRVLPDGEIGEIYCRGENVITSYFNAPGVNETRFHDGWLRTGDMGYLSEQGLLYLMGRSDDIINVAGQKLYPRDIENALYSHPKVFDVAVVGKPHPIKGQVVVAFLVSTEQDLDLRDLRSHCGQHVPQAFVPKVFQLVRELPRNPSGKVLTRELLATLMAGEEG